MIENLDRVEEKKSHELVLIRKRSRFHNFLFIMSLLNLAILTYLATTEVLPVSDIRNRLIIYGLSFFIFLGIIVNASYSRFLLDDIKRKDVDETTFGRY